jgi:alpha-mannosidase
VALKGYVRALSGYLQAARQLEFLVGRSDTGPNTDELEEAMAIVQHHDGVSGTERQHVSDDYSKRLAIGAAEVRQGAQIHQGVSSSIIAMAPARSCIS